MQPSIITFYSDFIVYYDSNIVEENQTALKIVRKRVVPVDAQTRTNETKITAL